MCRKCQGSSTNKSGARYSVKSKSALTSLPFKMATSITLTLLSTFVTTPAWCMRQACSVGQMWNPIDRDMPIKFPPIDWRKLEYKMDAAREAGVDKLITFEFSHFMSPNSMYPSARQLFKRYCEHFDL